MEKYSVIERLECPGCIYAEDLHGILTVIYLIYGGAIYGKVLSAEGLQRENKKHTESSH